MVEHFNIPFVIGAGSGGCRIVSRLSIESVKIAINSSWKDLEDLPENVLKIRAGEGKGSGMDPRMGEKHYKMCRDKFREGLEKILQSKGLRRDDVDIIPVVVTLGFGFGSGSGPLIIEDLKKWFPKTVVLAFVTKPFDFEGDRTYWNAWDSTRKIISRTGTIIIDNEYVAKLVGKDKNVLEALKTVNNYVSRCLETFLKAASSLNVLAGIDKTDVAKIAGRGMVRLFTTSITNFVDEELAKIYDSTSTLSEYVGEGRDINLAIFIQSPKTPPLEATEKIVSLVKETFNVNIIQAKTMIAVGGEKIRVAILSGGWGFELKRA